MKIQIGKDVYEVRPERTKQFHFLSEIKYYGYKNGEYVFGTTSNSEMESYNLLMETFKNAE